MLDSVISLTPLFFKFYLFIYSRCAGSSLPRGLSLIVASGGYSSLPCEGFSLRCLLLLQGMGSLALRLP